MTEQGQQMSPMTASPGTNDSSMYKSVHAYQTGPGQERWSSNAPHSRNTSSQASNTFMSSHHDRKRTSSNGMAVGPQQQQHLLLQQQQQQPPSVGRPNQNDLYFDQPPSLRHLNSGSPTHGGQRLQESLVKDEITRPIPTSTEAIVQSTFSGTKRRTTGDRKSRNDREEVWPDHLERVFLEALYVIPKLGRRKVLLGGKPSGRNELIADYIFKQTNIVRTRKQVSSHLQVLKNTRKNDQAFMRLLKDSDDDDDEMGGTHAPTKIHTPVSQSPTASPRLPPSLSHPGGHRAVGLGGPLTGNGYDTRHSFTSIEGGPSPVSHLVDDRPSKVSSLQDLYRSSIHERSFSYSIPGGAPINDPGIRPNDSQGHGGRSRSMNSMSRFPLTTPGSLLSTSPDLGWKDPADFDPSGDFFQTQDEDLLHSAVAVEPVIFRPKLFGLHTQYTTEPGADAGGGGGASGVGEGAEAGGGCDMDVRGLTRHQHDLVRCQELDSRTFGSISIHQLSTEKFPTLYELYQRAMLLESTEIKQAALVEQKYVYTFEFVNHFFNAFLSGVRSLENMGQVEIALNNLSVVQVFQSVDAEFESALMDPLLVIVFNFERGPGNVNAYCVNDALVC
ncbi:hypothetical protein BGW38_005198 [Lunasporangiospora selenospora]|uniref:TEA domain-containing protein n=1 Tax=Lunasporangiospora selenospora TaxID=979761 RepID=A0A9P6FP22_9FUNG|nr:hypothetical protein BGW38_005198 [Lunasporangiospora selenospora]